MERKKNVVLIVMDQEKRWTNLPVEFPFSKELPYRNKLLKESVFYNRMTCNTNPCTPSRGVLYTSQHINQTGCFANFIDLPVDEKNTPTLGHMMRHAGYYCCYKGKWHLGDGVNDLNARKSFDKDGRPNIKFGPPGGALNQSDEIDYNLETQDNMEIYGFSDWQAFGDKWGMGLEGFKYDSIYADSAKKWLETKGKELNQKNKPFFMAVNFINPHDIMFFLASAAQQKSKVDFENNFPGPFPAASFKFAPQTKMYEKEFNILPKTLHSHEDGQELPAPMAFYKRLYDRTFGLMTTDEEYMTNLDYYLNCMRDSDRHLGTVLNALEMNGMMENTVILLTSDHGEMAGEHSLRQKGQCIYKENIGIPFLIRFPSEVERKNITSNTLISSIDVVPTILAIAGVQNIKQKYPMIKGESILNDALGMGDVDDDKLPREVLFQYALSNQPKKDTPGRRPFCQAIITEQYKFARYFSGVSGYKFGYNSFEELISMNDLVLFDVLNDPDELHNLAQTKELMFQNKNLIENLNRRLDRLILKEAKRKEDVLMPWSMINEPVGEGFDNIKSSKL